MNSENLIDLDVRISLVANKRIKNWTSSLKADLKFIE